MNLKRVIATWGAFIVCSLPASVYGVSSADIQSAVTIAQKVGLHSILVPATNQNEFGKLTSREMDGMMILESSSYRFMEASHKISLDSPNEQESLPESIHGCQKAIWETYLLPGGLVQHSLSLEYDGLWVSIVPKWTSMLSKNGYASTEKNRLLSKGELEKVVTIAKSLHRVPIR